MIADLPHGLAVRLEVLAAARSLLVCLDYDGTLSEIVEDPAAAVPAPGARGVLADLATLPSTTVALLSGRSVGSLRALADPPTGVRLVGSHGLEFDGALGTALTEQEAELLARLRAALLELVDPVDGARLEDKPAGVAVHVRQCRQEAGDRLLRDVASGPGSWRRVHLMYGKRVVELSVRPQGKGEALARLMRESAATGVLVVGDDVTDEDAFARARDAGGPATVTVKVGPGATVAGFRVEGPRQVLALLDRLARLRRGPISAGAER